MDLASVSVIAGTVLIASIILWLVVRFTKADQSADEVVQKPDNGGDVVSNGTSAAISAKKLPKKEFVKGGKQEFTHPLLITTLKGHSGIIDDMDFSCNGKHLITTGADRSMILWYTKDFTDKEHRTCKGAIELDTACKIRFFPDSKSILVCLSSTNTLAVYKLVKKDGGHGYKFQPVEDVQFEGAHKRDIAFMDVSCDGKFVMTASTDLQIVVWSIRGDVIKDLQPKLSELYCARISPCGRLIVASGFTPDVKVYEVQRGKNGTVTDVKRAYELKGHNSGVHGAAFSQDSTRAVTASKDGTWRLWNTDIVYNQGEDAHLLLSGECADLHTADPSQVKVEIAPDGASFAISIRGASVRVNSVNGTHGPTRSLRYSTDGTMLATIGSSGTQAEKHVRLLTNAAGWAAALRRLKSQSQSSDAATRRRMAATCYGELWQEAKSALNEDCCKELFHGLREKL